MPYNTRRKSLSLPSLGIHLPSSSRAHRPSVPKTSLPLDTQPPPTKKVKRSHASNAPSPIVTSRPRSSTLPSVKNVSFAERPQSSGRAAYNDTPPPSPGAEGTTKIDIDEINDEIVAGVIEQLEKTGNRPHLIKELAAVLSNTNEAVLRYVHARIAGSSRIFFACWLTRVFLVARRTHRRCCRQGCRPIFGGHAGPPHPRVR